MLENNGLTGVFSTLPDLIKSTYREVKMTKSSIFFIASLRKGTKSVADRFWPKVAIGPDDECWPWIAKATAHYGYGRMSIRRGVQMRAHRVAWELTNGAITDGLLVCHRCDNPPCCNPNHLFLGTRKDNTHDAMKKGRMKPPPIHFGENHPMATIPDSEIPKIRSSKLKTTALAKMYGISVSSMSKIRRGDVR